MLISTTGAPATASALHGLQQAYDGDRQPTRFGALLGAAVMSEKAGEAYDHVLAVKRVARLLEPLVKQGWLVLPSIRFEGLDHQEVDFFVLSPLGVAYVLLVQRYARGRMHASLSEITGHGFRDSLPKAARDRSVRIEQVLKDNQIQYSSLTPVTVLVDIERLKASKSTISLALPDWKLVRSLRLREKSHRSFTGGHPPARDSRLLTPQLWEESTTFDARAFESDSRLFDQLRRWSIVSNVFRRVWVAILAAALAGGLSFVLLHALAQPQQMLMLH